MVFSAREYRGRRKTGKDARGFVRGLRTRAKDRIRPRGKVLFVWTGGDGPCVPEISRATGPAMQRLLSDGRLAGPRRIASGSELPLSLIAGYFVATVVRVRRSI